MREGEIILQGEIKNERRDHNEGKALKYYNETGYCNGQVLSALLKAYESWNPYSKDFMNPKNLSFSQSNIMLEFVILGY